MSLNYATIQLCLTNVSVVKNVKSKCWFRFSIIRFIESISFSDIVYLNVVMVMFDVHRLPSIAKWNSCGSMVYLLLSYVPIHVVFAKTCQPKLKRQQQQQQQR